MDDTARYRTPDGKFTLLVAQADDLIGFEKYPWHTHGEFLASVYQIGSIPKFLEALFSDRLVMAVSRTGDIVQDVSVTPDPDDKKDWVKEGETLELRYWSGRPYHAG
ncbi:MAG: hypothetical protein ACREXU_17545 [Gammaproteobacteria bacterium]